MNNISTLLKFMKKDRKGIEGGTVYAKRKRKDRRNHMEKIMHKENDWDHMTKASMLEGPIKKVSHKEMVIAIKLTKLEKEVGPLKYVQR